MSKKLCLILLLVFSTLFAQLAFSLNVSATQLDAESYFNPTYASSGYTNSVFGDVRFARSTDCGGSSYDYRATWNFATFGVQNYTDLYSFGSGECAINVIGGEMSLYNYGSDQDSDFATGVTIDTTPLGNLDYYALSTSVSFSSVTGNGITELTTRHLGVGLYHTLLGSETPSNFSGTFIIVPTNLTTFDHDWGDDYTSEDGTFRIYNNAIYSYRSINSDSSKGFSNLMGSTYYTTLDLSSIALSAPYGGPEAIYGAQLAIIFVPNADLQTIPLEGSWQNTPEEWCEVNAEDTNGCLEGWQVRPGISNTDTEKFNFELPNPLEILYIGFGAFDCSEIPTIAQFINLDNPVLCKVFPSNVRTIGNYVFSLLSIMLIFGFIIRLLIKSGEVAI